MPAVITLTTDFGDGSPYVAALKGVIVGIDPAARILDLSHRLPPQDLQQADFFLAAAVPHFPAGTIHVAVIDPGVGSDRQLLCVQLAGQQLLVPDNGCWTSLARGQRPVVRVLANRRYWRGEVSATFHGRDILAPVAAHLSRGLDPAELGPLATDWVKLEVPEATMDLAGQEAAGQVVFVDAFGNLITNIPEAMAEIFRGGPVQVAGQRISRWLRTYADAPPGSLVALVSSFGTLEIAVVQGHAARQLGVAAGAAVTLRRPCTV